MKIEKITREAEAALPKFNSHREARMYFKIKYGDAFEIDDSFVVGEGENSTICYRYSLVLDRETYEKGMRQLAQEKYRVPPGHGSMSDAGAFLSSYQTIEIMLDGDIHVIH